MNKRKLAVWTALFLTLLIFSPTLIVNAKQFTVASQGTVIISNGQTVLSSFELVKLDRMNETLLKELTEEQTDDIARAALRQRTQSECSHAWVLKNRQWIHVTYPGYSGPAWSMTYECSRCGAMDTVIVVP